MGLLLLLYLRRDGAGEGTPHLMLLPVRRRNNPERQVGIIFRSEWTGSGGCMEFAIQLIIILICLFYGARKGGIALGLLGGILGIFAGSKGFSLLWPYALMQAGMNANKSEDALAGSYGMFFLSCAFWLAAMFLLAWGLLRKRDVKA